MAKFLNIFCKSTPDYAIFVVKVEGGWSTRMHESYDEQSIDEWAQEAEVYATEQEAEDAAMEENWSLSGDLPEGDASYSPDFVTFMHRAETLMKKPVYWHYGGDHIAICVRMDSLPIEHDPCIKLATVEDANTWLTYEYEPSTEPRLRYFWPNADHFLALTGPHPASSFQERLNAKLSEKAQVD